MRVQVPPPAPNPLRTLEIRSRIWQNRGPSPALVPGLPARLFAEAADRLASTFARCGSAIENRLNRALNQVERMQRLPRGEAIPARVERLCV